MRRTLVGLLSSFPSRTDMRPKRDSSVIALLCGIRGCRIGDCYTLEQSYDLMILEELVIVSLTKVVLLMRLRILCRLWTSSLG